MKRILLVGFHVDEAIEYAIERGWRVNRARLSFSTPKLLAEMLPFGAPVDRVRGMQADEIVRGPHPLDANTERFISACIVRGSVAA